MNFLKKLLGYCDECNSVFGTHDTIRHMYIEEKKKSNEEWRKLETEMFAKIKELEEIERKELVKHLAQRHTDKIFGEEIPSPYFRKIRHDEEN